MQLRTKLFLTSSSIVLLLWAGAWWPIQHMISGNFDRLAIDNFKATRQSLRTLQAEQVKRMRQVGTMVMNIPELRALIAEHNFELSADNLASLQERLDSLATIIDTKFICVLDSHGAVITQNSQSPWQTNKNLRDYIGDSKQALPLIRRLFSPVEKDSQGQRQEYGLWVFGGQLYQVVGLPLVFSSDPGDADRPDGALIMASPVTAEMATTLGKSHNCQISFLSHGTVLASSLASSAQKQVLHTFDQFEMPSSTSFDFEMGDVNYASYLEPLEDSSSHTIVGATLIQSSQADAAAMQRKVSLSLLAIMSSGLFAAGCISFFVSGAITKPVRELVRAVHRVAEGDMESSIHADRHDEIGQLATAFNDMVVQLRHRQELQRLVDETQAATKAKSQFLANMSHEIRTPLNGVIGVANLLLSTPLNEKQRHYTQLVRSSTEVLTTLINDILDFSKIEAGKLELESVDFNLCKVVEDAVELLSLKAAEKGVKTTAVISDDVPKHVCGDPNRLRQILMNLIGNAVKFTDKGAITVEVNLANAWPDGISIRFAIKDTGPGIPPDRMERLFKSFSQVDASTTRRYGGTGLGLAISKQLAELMGGNIGVESELGHGSTFWFTSSFKTANEPQHAVAVGSTPTSVADRGRAIRILLAEDNSINQIVASDLLTNFGYHVHVVGDGHSAVKALQEGEFDLVLMDCQMPVMDGLDATRAIRQVESEKGGKGHRIPIIALTANASNVDRGRCTEAGMDGYCSKPFKPKELLDMVAEFTTNAKPSNRDTGLRPVMEAVDPAISVDFNSQATITGQRPVSHLADQDSSNAPQLVASLSPSNRDTGLRPVMGASNPETNVDSKSQTDLPAPQPTESLRVQTLLESCTQNSVLAMKILDKFQKQVTETAVQLEGAMKARDAAELARLSHALKGTAGIVGAESLRVKLAQLETFGRESDLESADKQLVELREEIDRCAAAIGPILAELKEGKTCGS